MTTYHPIFQAEADASTAAGMDFAFDGTALVWRRNGWALSWAGERQSLPVHSAPLKMGEGRPVCGQGWTEAEIDLFASIVGSPAVVYEYPTKGNQ